MLVLSRQIDETIMIGDDVELTIVDIRGDKVRIGIIASLHHRMDVETALRFAQASAGLVATGLGSDAGIVSFEDTLDKMKNWKIKR